jgi:hypothetical protein
VAPAAETWYRHALWPSQRSGSTKDTFKQIFHDHWETFQQRQPRYQDRHVQAVIEKILGCGTPEAGYMTYLYPHCLEEKRVAFGCKSSFCLSCCNRDRLLLADLMQCGVAMLNEALSWFTQVKLETGYVVVLETAGRSGHWNPHLPIIMTSGGMTPQKRWREVDYFPFKVLHKKWHYHLFTMLKQRVGTRAVKVKIDALWRQYAKGLVAYLEEGKVPAGGEGLASYLAKYVMSPPISLRRILSYDGQRVRYWYNDHKTQQRQEEEVSAFTLHATCKAKKMKEVLTGLLVALGRLIKGTYRITARQTYRERVLASTGRDPLRCVRCGRGMILWQVWHPRYGVVYDELQAIKCGRYGPCRRLPPGAGAGGAGDTPMTQLALAGLQV